VAVGIARFHVVSPVVAVAGGTWRAATAPESRSAAWRLLGGNNRELGRSQAVHTDEAACRAAIQLFRADLDQASPLLSRDAQEGTWTWRLSATRGRTLACSGRAYARERECRYALGAFLASAPTADFTHGLVPS
jgi:uncharacterized protein YegP (UPF0339 family)